MTDLLGKPIPDFHESHTCKDCGAVITIPYAKPADPGGLRRLHEDIRQDMVLSDKGRVSVDLNIWNRLMAALTPEATAPTCTCGPDETDGHALGCPMLGAPEATAPAPHPGENHDFDMHCKTCGEPGTLFVAFLAPGERMELVP